MQVEGGEGGGRTLLDGVLEGVLPEGERGVPRRPRVVRKLEAVLGEGPLEELGVGAARDVRRDRGRCRGRRGARERDDRAAEVAHALLEAGDAADEGVDGDVGHGGWCGDEAESGEGEGRRGGQGWGRVWREGEDAAGRAVVVESVRVCSCRCASSRGRGEGERGCPSRESGGTWRRVGARSDDGCGESGGRRGWAQIRPVVKVRVSGQPDGVKRRRREEQPRDSTGGRLRAAQGLDRRGGRAKSPTPIVLVHLFSLHIQQRSHSLRPCKSPTCLLADVDGELSQGEGPCARTASSARR